MTVLRSREIVPTIKSDPSSPKTLEKGLFIEPTTPAKALEKPSNLSSFNTTPSTRPFNQCSVGSDLGTSRRRSLRLASKASSNEIIGSDLGLPRKRKSSVCIFGRNFENVRREELCYTESSGFDVEVDRDNISGGIRTISKVSKELDTEMDVEVQSREVSESVSMVNEDSSMSGMETELSSDMGSLRQSREQDVGPKTGKEERKFGVNVDSPVSGREDETTERCLKLRRGKKIYCGRVERSYVGGESHNGYDINGGKDRKINRVLDNKNMECFVMNNPEGEVIDNVNYSITGRQRSSIEEGTKESSIDFTSVVEFSDAPPLTGGSDSKGLENGPSAHGTSAGDQSIRRLRSRNKGKGKVVENDLLSSHADVVEFVIPKLQKLKKVENCQNADTNCNTNKGKKRLSKVEKGKGKVVENSLLPDCVDVVELGLPEAYTLKELESHPSTDTSGIKDRSKRRFSREEKGKGKVVENVNRLDSPKVKKSNGTPVSGTSPLVDDVAMEDGDQVMENEASDNIKRTLQRFRNIARKNASRFAHFSSQEVEDKRTVDEAYGERSREVETQKEDWPGPFSTAMKIIKDRGMNVNLQHQNISSEKSKSAPLVWIPRKYHNRKALKLSAPSLQELCLAILVKKADAITSLDNVPDVLRHRLSHLLCDSRRMNSHFLELLVSGSPTEIRVRDCSWLTEEDFTKFFQGADMDKLTVLQLDQCGRSLPDYILYATLARSSNSLPALSTISLKGACRLSDVGLNALLSSAPALRSMNLSQCSLLTSDGIYSIADSLGSVLRELYLDDLQSIDPLLILPALSKLEYLEVLSLAGVQAVCDDFLCQFVAVRGHNLKELVLTDCVKLTDSSLKVISETCSGLCAINLTNLCKLTDSAIGYLANGCQSIRSMRLCRNAFSDEAIAAYLETCGQSLEELSLNNCNKVANNTAISLSRNSRNLVSLDLSWCRNLTNEAIGLIVDSSSALKMLKLFGCTQVTNVFLDGQSNAQLQVIGLKMSPILKDIKVPDLLGPLHYS